MGTGMDGCDMGDEGDGRNEDEDRDGDEDGDRTVMGVGTGPAGTVGPRCGMWHCTPHLTPLLILGLFRAILRDDVPPGGPAGWDAALHRPPCPPLLPVSTGPTMGGTWGGRRGERCVHGAASMGHGMGGQR